MCGGRQERRAPESLWESAGILFQKCVKFRSPEMPFPEAISSFYLILVMIFPRYSHDSAPETLQTFIHVYWFPVFFNGDFLIVIFGSLSNAPPPPPPPPHPLASYGHGLGIRSKGVGYGGCQYNEAKRWQWDISSWEGTPTFGATPDPSNE